MNYANAGLYAVRFDAYTKAAVQFTASQAVLKDTQTAATQIDRILRECVLWVCKMSHFCELYAKPISTGATSVLDSAY